MARAEDGSTTEVFLEYGDDSVAQLGGVHLACEQASNLLTKILEWGRLMAYLEQSTRYIAYDARLHRRGRYRYLRDPADPRFAPRGPLRGRPGPDVRHLRRDLLPVILQAWFTRAVCPREPGGLRLRLPPLGAAGQGLRRSCRGLLPAAAYLQRRHLHGTGPRPTRRAAAAHAGHPLPEARAYADLMLVELRKVIPSFLKRVDLPDRGGAASAYLEKNRRAMAGSRRRASSGGSTPVWSSSRRRPTAPRSPCSTGIPR